MPNNYHEQHNMSISKTFFYSYDSTTGTFTVPPGGDGYYYFSVYLNADGDESSIFDVELNGERICTVRSDLTESPSTDWETTVCSGITYAVEGISKCIHLT